MLPCHSIETFLQRTPPRLQDIVLELRNIIASAAPDAAEVIRWGGLSYYHEGRGGIVSAGICQIGLGADHIRLDFIHGAYLPDPQGLLRGTQKAKRFVKIDSYDHAAWKDLKEIIVSASKFDPRSLKRNSG
jgi:hypothetical protein